MKNRQAKKISRQVCNAPGIEILSRWKKSTRIVALKVRQRQANKAAEKQRYDNSLSAD